MKPGKKDNVKRMTLAELKASDYNTDEKRELLGARLREVRARAEQLGKDASAPDAVRACAEDTTFALDIMDANDTYARARLEHYKRQAGTMTQLATRLLGYLARRATQADEVELMQMRAELEVAQADLVVLSPGGLFLQ